MASNRQVSETLLFSGGLRLSAGAHGWSNLVFLPPYPQDAAAFSIFFNLQGLDRAVPANALSNRVFFTAALTKQLSGLPISRNPRLGPHGGSRSTIVCAS
jgi:hypothetical protein